MLKKSLRNRVKDKKTENWRKKKRYENKNRTLQEVKYPNKRIFNKMLFSTHYMEKKPAQNSLRLQRVEDKNFQIERASEIPAQQMKRGICTEKFYTTGNKRKFYKLSERMKREEQSFNKKYKESEKYWISQQ